MAEYSVGIATRNRIYEAARTLFYQKGIEETSYRDICEAADVNRGLIPYHFKSKDNIASLVLEEFFQGIERAVDEHWGELAPAIRNILIEIFQFKLLESNENVLRFYGEVFAGAAFHKDTVAEERAVVAQLCEGAGVNLPPEAVSTVARMLNGTEAELVLALKEGEMREPLETYVRRDMMVCYFLLNVDMERASAWIDEAFEMSRGLTAVCDESFSCTVVDE